MTYSELQGKVWDTADNHGWHDKPTSPLIQIALMHSELSEATEAYREHTDVHHMWLRDSDGKPEGFAVELADTVIRIMDFCEEHDIDLEALIIEKDQFNESRPYRHGKQV